jgi:hypothetical protein
VKYLTLGLQASGFFVSLFALFLHWQAVWFVVAFAVHVAGDVLFISAEGLPKFMSNFLSGISSWFDTSVKKKNWIQYVGLALAAIFTASVHGWQKYAVLVSLLLSGAGALYYALYKDTPEKATTPSS